ncbi:MAG: STAS domain-containing protein [Actinomycetota bacterium]|nr:STAS domain-containing protein [Actinomycetota bacterium]
MDVSVEQLDEATACVMVTGRVAMGQPAKLEELLHGLVVAGTRRIVVDLSEVPFLNSKPLDTLVRISASIDPAHRGVAVLTSQTYVKHMLEVTESGGVLLLEDSKDAALAALA